MVARRRVALRRSFPRFTIHLDTCDLYCNPVMEEVTLLPHVGRPVTITVKQMIQVLKDLRVELEKESDVG